MRVLRPSELVTVCAASLGVDPTDDVNAMLKPALRRAAYLLAPASAASICRFVSEPLGADETLNEDIEAALEELIAYGDILEMRRIEGDPWDVPDMVLRPAPPAFVPRSQHEAFILGVAGDFPTPLPADPAHQMSDAGPVRLLRCSSDDQLIEHLRAFGLSELTEQAWLRLPPSEPPSQHVEAWRARLAAAPSSAGAIEGLEVLDGSRSSRFYAGRWRALSAADSGLFAARRPHHYGGRLWSVVSVTPGEPTRLLDIPAGDGFERPCDVVWRLQAALDARHAVPQSFGVVIEGVDAHLDFYGPLPSFAERKLALVGSKTAAPKCLFRFTIPTAALQAETAFLQSSLWMQPAREGGQR